MISNVRTQCALTYIIVVPYSSRDPPPTKQNSGTVFVMRLNCIQAFVEGRSYSLGL